MSWRESARGGLKNARQFAGRLIREYGNLKGTLCQGAKRDFRKIPAQNPNSRFGTQPIQLNAACYHSATNPTSATYKICSEKVSNYLAAASTAPLSGLLG